jgi:hypothetical protein
MKVQHILFVFLIAVNLTSLYFIIDFFVFDEIEDCLVNEQKKLLLTRGFAYLIYITALSNLYFLSFIVIKVAFKKTEIASFD